ncbi:uncharacterized protein EV420DRAFT_1647266 [Desarmillaria tabescens]|uniref:Uncharacterized protein n=1 Tax=Armillaria tabescens TaxID=1929756 RepID=A0AA39JU69_ARMTA|nr:uncharacterized protein EV420DRAFT_1647266 [Desarmillaria tabescens]KAK0448990.1 hypothetical protein EV420DRAFT_1647266 [Desarmillaria tabescens]
MPTVTPIAVGIPNLSTLTEVTESNQPSGMALPGIVLNMASALAVALLEDQKLQHEALTECGTSFLASSVHIHASSLPKGSSSCEGSRLATPYESAPANTRSPGSVRSVRTGASSQVKEIITSMSSAELMKAAVKQQVRKQGEEVSVSSDGDEEAEQPSTTPGDTPGIRLPIDFVILHQFMQSTSGTEGYSGGFVLVAKYYIKNESTAVQNGLRNDISKSQFYQPSTRQAKPYLNKTITVKSWGLVCMEYKNQEVEEWNELDASLP